MTSTIWKIALVAVGFGLAAGCFAWGASEETSASVTILRPLAVETIQPMDFGAITPPTEGTQTFSLSEVDSQLSAGPGDGNASGESLVAQFAVSGEPNLALDVQAEITQAFGDANITLNDLVLGGDASFDPSGLATITMGGTIAVGAAAEPGRHGDAVVTVTVNYQ